MHAHHPTPQPGRAPRRLPTSPAAAKPGSERYSTFLLPSGQQGRGPIPPPPPPVDAGEGAELIKWSSYKERARAPPDFE